MNVLHPDTLIPGAKTNLASALVPFFPRPVLQRALRDAIQAGHRAIVVTGGPGVGKTAIVRDLLQSDLEEGRWSGGVWGVDLGPIPSGRDLETSLVEVFKVAEDRGNESLLRIAHAVSERGDTVLFLDTFDRLARDDRALAVLRQLLDYAPELVLVITSRSRIASPGFVHIEVAGLSSEPSGQETLSEAERFFQATIQRHDPTFSLGAAVRDQAKSLLARVDHNPLAIELLSARVAFLGIESAFEALSGGSDVSDGFIGRDRRQSSLRESVRWSWEQLNEAEKSALAQASVFSGGFSPESALAVLTGPDDAPISIDLLQSLRTKSLLVWGNRTSGRPRFEVLQLIRDFAATELNARGNAEATKCRHQRHFLDASMRWRAERLTAHGDSVRRHVQIERHNLMTALSGPDDELSASLLVELEPWIGSIFSASESLEVIQRLLRCSRLSAFRGRLLVTHANVLRLLGQAPQSIALIDNGDCGERKAEAALAAGRALMAMGQMGPACERLRAAIALADASSARDVAAEANLTLGAALLGRGELEGAEAAYRRAHDELQSLGAVHQMARPLVHLGNLFLDRGRLDDARWNFERAFELVRDSTDEFQIAFIRANRGAAAYLEGKLAHARPEFAFAVDSFRRLGASSYAGAYEGFLGILELEAGDRAAARAHLREAVATLEAAGDLRWEAYFQGLLALSLADPESANDAQAASARAKSLAKRVDSSIVSAAVESLSLAVDALLGSQRERVTDALAPIEALARQSGELVLTRRVIVAAMNVGTPTDGGLSASATDGVVLRVGMEGHWFEVRGAERVDLRRRPVLQRLLWALVTSYAKGESSVVTQDELIAATWPGESIQPRAAINRFHVALNALRKLGLASVVEFKDGGYRFVRGLIVRTAQPEAAGRA